MSEIETNISPASLESPPSDPTVPVGTRAARRAFRVLVPAAAIAVALAVLLNWLALPNGGEALPSGPGSVGGDIPPPAEVTLGKPSLDLLPDRVLQYETITHQAIPGQADRGAEAIYKTLSMNLEAQIPTVVYGRVEGLASSASAEERLQSLTAQYTLDRHEEPLGSTLATVGWTQDKSAFMFAWVDGQYVTLVKASFAEWTPEWNFEIIEKQGRKVADAVRVYQESGRQGVSK